jgi:hypothetical protein
MSAAHLLEDLTQRGVTLWSENGRVRCRGPKSVVTPEVVAKLKEHKEELLYTLSNGHPLECGCPYCSTRAPRYAKIRNTGEVLEMARGIFGVVEDPVTPPAPPGRDPLAKKNTDKARFFCGDWREAWPENFTVHRPDTGGAA